MNRTLSLLLAVLLAGLAGCAREEAAPSLSPADRTALYQTAIEQARDQDANDAFALVTASDQEQAEIIFSLLGVEASDMQAYALSASPMITQAYAVAAALPAEGRADAVQAGFQGFIDQQQRNFQQYLPDQYDIALNARLETLSDGTVLLVMCPDQDTVFDALRTAIEGGASAE